MHNVFHMVVLSYYIWVYKYVEVFADSTYSHFLVSFFNMTKNKLAALCDSSVHLPSHLIRDIVARCKSPYFIPSITSKFLFSLVLRFKGYLLDNRSWKHPDHRIRFLASFSTDWLLLLRKIEMPIRSRHYICLILSSSFWVTDRYYKWFPSSMDNYPPFYAFEILFNQYLSRNRNKLPDFHQKFSGQWRPRTDRSDHRFWEIKSDAPLQFFARQTKKWQSSCRQLFFLF